MRLRGRTLRARITALLVVVLLVATAVVGVVTALSLRAFLIGRLDDQLAAAGGRFAVTLEHPGDRDGDEAVPGQSVGTLGVRLVGGAVTEAAVVDPAGMNTTPSLSADDVRAMADLPVGGAARTVDLHDLGDYRLRAVAGRDGDVQVTGLPEEGVDATLARLATIESLVFVGVILVAAVVVAALVRRTLQPLERVADTARQVADLPLTEAATPLPTGLAPAHPTTEVDQVSSAFEHMLDHIRTALAARDATEERLRRFVADASHELRTPLATVRAYAEFARRQGQSLPPATQAALARIEAAGDRMSVLVEELLVLARLDESRPVARDEVDVVQLVAEIVMDARTATPDHRWRLALPETAVTVHGDADALHRAVENLVRNAATHTPDGTTVAATVTADAARVVVEVADDGPGIPADQLATVFDRFTRVDDARSGAGGGSGLGLAITRGVVRAHGGTVQVTSVPGDTRFTVELPLALDPL